MFFFDRGNFSTTFNVSPRGSMKCSTIPKEHDTMSNYPAVKEPRLIRFSSGKHGSRVPKIRSGVVALLYKCCVLDNCADVPPAHIVPHKKDGQFKYLALHGDDTQPVP
nr:hypothetical protein [Candidatus Sigynarchaeum springense]